MRTATLFTASFALLALLLSPAAASPGGTRAVECDAAADKVDGFEHAAATAAAIPAIETRAPDEGANVTALTGRQVAVNPYNIPCITYPNVCENWCYYVFCHKLATSSSSQYWTVTVNRTAGLRPQSECGKYSPNKCSVLSQDPWVANPVANQDCDEQPKNTNNEGGANAATRCMPRSENRGEGSLWSQYINQGGPGRIADGTQIKVVLQAPLGPLCSSYRLQSTTVCPAPASPNDVLVALDAIRQQ